MMATVLAAALMVNEVPQLTDFAGAVSEEREQAGVLIKPADAAVLGFPYRSQALQWNSLATVRTSSEAPCTGFQEELEQGLFGWMAKISMESLNEKLQADVMWIHH